MVILGLSAFYHDAAAALVQDGRVVAAAHEERFSRIKHDPAYPRRAIDACLAAAGLAASDIGLVAFYEKPFTKLDRILDTTMAVSPLGLKRWADALPSWFGEKLRLDKLLADHLGYTGDVVYTGHHESHAASAFFLSPFDEAATLTLDGVGEWTTNAIGHGRGSRLQLLQEIRFPHSLGLLYSAFTQYLGFRVNEGEYKVMGLAPYGEPRFADVIRAHLIDIEPDGSYRLNLRHFDFLHGDSTIGSSFADLFQGPPRGSRDPTTQRHMDVARSIQAVTEEIVLKQARHVREVTGSTRLCMAGGVALNSVANGRLVNERIFDEVWIQPAAGDAGGAVGAAITAWHHVLGNPRLPASGGDGMLGAALGPQHGDDEIRAAVAELGLTAEALDEPTLIDRVADLLADGKVVGWHHGRMEFGPRSLGHRSILADPRRAEMQSRVNQSVKFREGFRPFAPAIPEEQADAWFDLEGRKSPYMLLVVPVAEARRTPLSADDAAKVGLDRLRVDRSVIPAVTHVDFSARVQTVSAADKPRFHALLTRFGDKTGVPILMNTSFNLKDEPIVSSPLHACHTFLASSMDALVLGDHLVLRPPDRPPTKTLPAPPPKHVAARTTGQLRTFGVGGGLILGALAWLQHSHDRTWLAAPLAAVAVLLFLPGLVWPRALVRVEEKFAVVGGFLGHYNGRLLLALVYLLVVTPVGLLRRTLSGDPLEDTRPAVGKGHWRPLVHDPDDREKYRRMF